MRSAQLHPGLPVEVDVRGQKFNATVKGVDRGRVSILPFEPHRFTYRTVSSRQVVKALEVQGRFGVTG